MSQSLFETVTSSSRISTSTPRDINQYLPRSVQLQNPACYFPEDSQGPESVVVRSMIHLEHSARPIRPFLVLHLRRLLRSLESPLGRTVIEIAQGHPRASQMHQSVLFGMPTIASRKEEELWTLSRLWTMAGLSTFFSEA